MNPKPSNILSGYDSLEQEVNEPAIRRNLDLMNTKIIPKDLLTKTFDQRTRTLVEVGRDSLRDPEIASLLQCLGDR